MHGLVPRSPSSIGAQISTWMPDQGVHEYVSDMLEELGVDNLEEILATHPNWIPLTILGSMDWVFICGWWVFSQTGVFDSEDQYRWIYYLIDDDYEIDPSDLTVFRESRERNKFQVRKSQPGLEKLEKIEAISFLIHDYFPSFDEDPPPVHIAELVLYSTLMWILSDYGRNWLASKEPVFHSIKDYGVAYLHRKCSDDLGGTELFHPDGVVCKERPCTTCTTCGALVWCVLGTYIDNIWEYSCINCAMERVENGAKRDFEDRRFDTPACPHYGGKCMSTSCPHSGVSEEDILEKMQEVGSQRLDEYREQIRSMGGHNPRMIAGQTTEDIVGHFADIICMHCDRPIMSVKRLLERTQKHRNKFENMRIEFDCPHCGGAIAVEENV